MEPCNHGKTNLLLIRVLGTRMYILFFVLCCFLLQLFVCLRDRPFVPLCVGTHHFDHLIHDLHLTQPLGRMGSVGVMALGIRHDIGILLALDRESIEMHQMLRDVLASAMIVRLRGGMEIGIVMRFCAVLFLSRGMYIEHMDDGIDRGKDR